MLARMPESGSKAVMFPRLLPQEETATKRRIEKLLDQPSKFGRCPMCAKAASKQVPYDATAGGGSTGSRLPKSAGNQRLSICNSGPT